MRISCCCPVNLADPLVAAIYRLATRTAWAPGAGSLPKLSTGGVETMNKKESPIIDAKTDLPAALHVKFGSSRRLIYINRTK
jgi:hypothetical protein